MQSAVSSMSSLQRVRKVQPFIISQKMGMVPNVPIFPQEQWRIETISSENDAKGFCSRCNVSSSTRSDEDDSILHWTLLSILFTSDYINNSPPCFLAHSAVPRKRVTKMGKADIMMLVNSVSVFVVCRILEPLLFGDMTKFSDNNHRSGVKHTNGDHLIWWSSFVGIWIYFIHSIVLVCFESSKRGK